MSAMMVPEGWEVKTVSQTCDILDNKRIPLNDEERQSMKGHIPYYGANAIVDYIDSYLFDEDLILLAEDGGNFDDYENRQIAYKITGKAWVNNHAHIVRPKKMFDFDFIFYSLQHKNITSFIRGGTRSKLNQSDLKAVELLTPISYSEQQKIATILSTLDRTIEATQKLIDKEKMVKKGLMADLLTHGIDEQGRIRSPQTHTYVDSPLGMIPKGWEVVELQESFEYISYGFTNPMPTTEIGPFMVTATDIKNGQISYQTCRKTSQEAYDSLLTKKSKPIKNDILLTKDGSLGRIALMDDSIVCINQSVALLRPKKSQNPIFLKHLLESPMYQKKMLHDAGGSTIKHIYITVVDKMKIMKPMQTNEQNQIAAILSVQDRKIETEETNLAKLQNLKKGLMGDLLSGKVRVK